MTNCDGSDSSIVSALECLIPMTTLEASPYNYVLGETIVVKVLAYNAEGWSAASSATTAGTAVLQTIPTTMTTLSRGSSTTGSQIEVTWTALSTDAQKGGAVSILSYHL